MSNEKKLTALVGGPLDGLEIEVYPLDSWTISPGPHHREEAGITKRPFYEKHDDGQYHFGGYWLDEDCEIPEQI